MHNEIIERPLRSFLRGLSYKYRTNLNAYAFHHTILYDLVALGMSMMQISRMLIVEAVITVLVLQ